MSLQVQRTRNPFRQDTPDEEAALNEVLTAWPPSTSTARVGEASTSRPSLPSKPDKPILGPQFHGVPGLICTNGPSQYTADISLTSIPACMEACLQILYNRNRQISPAILEDILKAASQYRGEINIEATDLRAGLRRYNDSLKMINCMKCSLTDLPGLVDNLAAKAKKQGEPVATIITKSLESIVIVVQNEPNKPTVFFDFRPRPDLHPHGPAFILFEDRSRLVKYLQKLMPATLESNLHRWGQLDPTTDVISVLTLKAERDGIDMALEEKDLLMLELQYENLELRQQQARFNNRFEQAGTGGERALVPQKPSTARQSVSLFDEPPNLITRNTGKQTERTPRYESDFEMAQRLNEEEYGLKVLDDQDTVMAMALQEEYRVEAGAWEFECPLCSTINPHGDVFHLDDCNHSMCRSCAAQYVLGAVLDGEFPCLCPCCKAVKGGRVREIPQHLAMSVLSLEDQEMWLTMERDYAMTNNSDLSFMYCRKADCGILFEAGTAKEAERLTYVACPYCQHEWCNKCDLDKWHQGETCQQYHAGFCSRQGCESRRYRSPQNPNQYYNYCSAACLWKETESLVKTKITLLEETNLDYVTVKAAFDTSIRFPTTVNAIYQITYPSVVAKPFFDNRQALGRSIRRFHGTRTVLCGMASELAKGKAAAAPPNFCMNGACGPCGIIQNGLRGGHDRQVWSGGSAATSHGYTVVYPGSTARVMFICDAAVAALGEAAPVLNGQLILPRFLVLYSL